MKRRSVLGALVAVGGMLWLPQAGALGQTIAIEVWKSPTCGCCAQWITHVEGNGFKAKVNDVGNASIRDRLKVPAKFGSCHTALVDGYAIEGHVPAADIRRLLQQRPDAIGLAVPGMPLGSPGMDGPAYDNRREPYDVLLLGRNGSSRVFNSYFKS